MPTEIETRTGFPGCMGFLDRTDMTLQYRPSFHSETYFNRKKKYGLNIQAICDEQRRFRFVSSGYPGSVSNATVFCESSFFQSPNQFFWRPDDYILADKAYPVTRRCMTPYKEPWASVNDGGYQDFNLRLAETWVKIKHVFGVLQNRWCSLQGIQIHIRGKKDHGRAIGWILACMVLHNFLADIEDDQIWQLEKGELQAEPAEREHENYEVD